MKHNEILIIKLGGSSITNKSQFETLDQLNIDWVSNTLSAVVQLNNLDSRGGSDHQKKNRRRIILVHGAGSFGHFHAKQYGFRGVSSMLEEVNEPDRNNDTTTTTTTAPNKGEQNVSEGLVKTRLSVQKLHWNLLSCLSEKGHLPVVGLSPFSINPTLNGISSTLGKNIEELLHNREDLIPVLHGDCILLPNSSSQQQQDGTTMNKNVRILGGDKLVTIIASHFIKNRMYHVRVIFVTDVDGVYTSDPNLSNNNNAKLVPIIEILQNNSGDIRLLGCGEEKGAFDIIDAGKSTHEHDVTGGLKAKLDEAMSIVKLGVEVTIVKCGSTCAEKAIRGEVFDKGTIIRLEKSL